MNLVTVIRKVLDAAATQGAEAAGIAVCGPLWAVLRPVVVPVVQSVAQLPSVPDERLAAAIAEVEERDENARALVQALRPALDGLNEDLFQILRMQAHIGIGLTQLHNARRRTLYWQLLAAAEIPQFWFAARKDSTSPEAIRPLRTALSQIGLSSEAIDHITHELQTNRDDQEALLQQVSTISCCVHPFVGTMAKTGRLLMEREDAHATVIEEWERFGLGSTVAPYLREMAPDKQQSDVFRALMSMVEVVAAEG